MYKMLPDDVIDIISAFSKPLPKKRQSSYWKTQTLEEMVDDIMIKFETYIKQCYTSYTLEHTSSPWSIRAWMNGRVVSTLCFTQQDILNWNGTNFECRSVNLNGNLHLTAGTIVTYLCQGDKKIGLLCVEHSRSRSMYKIYV